MTGTSLHAETLVRLGSPAGLIARMHAAWSEHCRSEPLDGGWRIAFSIGAVTVRETPGAARFGIEADDAASLAILQGFIADQLVELTDGADLRIRWEGGAVVGAPPPYFRAMRVIEARQVTPRMRRLRLAGDDLARFAHGGLHMRLLLPARPGERPVWPVTGPDGRQAWPEGDRPVARVYTIRRIDVAAGEVEVDFVLHEGDDMPGAFFAQNARAGDAVGMTGPGGADTPKADWILLAGDETALPAIARGLEEMPAGQRVRALVEIADDEERQTLRTKADLELTWLSRGGRPAGSTTLLQDAVAATGIPEDGRSVFVSAGCEHGAFRAIRKYWRGACGLSRDRHLAVAYWRMGKAGEAAQD